MGRRRGKETPSNDENSLPSFAYESVHKIRRVRKRGQCFYSTADRRDVVLIASKYPGPPFSVEPFRNGPFGFPTVAPVQDMVARVSDRGS